jgi:neutral ceramidase
MFAYTARSGFAGFPDPTLQIIGDPDENGYAKSFVPSRGIHTRVLARAIVLEQAGKKFALVQVDLGGIPYALVQEVMSRLEGTGITTERFLLSATHTHSSTGPIWPADSQGYALLGGDAFEPRVFELTAQGIADAVLAANQRLEPARAGMGVAQVADASRNRGMDPFKANPEIPDDDAGARPLSIDQDVTVLRVDAANGRPIGVWSNFAIHPTSFGDGNLLFSGDNPATAERDAEAAITEDAAARGVAPPADRRVVNVWTNSHEGDISPRGDPDTAGGDALQYVPTSAAGANNAGRRVGAGIVNAWRNAESDMSNTIEIDAKQGYMPFDGSQHDGEPVGPVPVLGQGGITMEDKVCAPVDNFAGPGQGKKFPLLAGVGLVPQINPIAVWRVGRLGIAGIPSEVTLQQGRRIRNALVADSGGRVGRFALAGLSNGYVSYTATPEEYDICHYEGSFTLFGRRQGPRILAFSKGVLAALVTGGAAPGVPEPPPTGFGLPPEAPIDETPTAGDVVQAPAATVRRYERAVFRWQGGDPAIDPPRGQAFVTLQRQVGSDWQTVGTEDSYFDTTEQDDDKVWTETWQFDECDPLGTYRFVVKGVADKGSGVAPYEVTSASFQLQPTLPLQPVPAAPVVAGGQASVLFRYPSPGPALVALPRRLRTGQAVFTVDPPGAPGPSDVPANLDSDKLNFVANGVPDGSAVTVKSVADECGNTGP